MSEQLPPMTKVTVKYFNPNKPEDGEQTYTKVLPTSDDPDFELRLIRSHYQAFENKSMINISVSLSDYPEPTEPSEPEKEDVQASESDKPVRNNNRK